MTLLYYIFYIIFQPFSSGENLDRWLIELKPNQERSFDRWWTSTGFEKNGFLKRTLTVENWIVIEIPQYYSDSLKQLSCIQTILVDEKLNIRNTIPNDPQFINQGGMELIGMPSAWDITTGGITERGDTIVVAIIDDGFQIDHEDLMNNVWHNHDEIPNDEIDNDGNGYVDDYNGLNVGTGSDKHPIRSHGTSVSGIIGASGNNEKGVSGINWNVKILLISYNSHISELVDAYQYVLDLRKVYNQTLGKKGAFIVAVNLSSGLDNGLPQNFPLWCSMYDKLGAEGVLSVCSAPNSSHSVDKDGGLPSRCPSPYTINVTNVSPVDIIMDNAGYGRISIDLAAPGENSLTTDTSNSYNYFRGTSASAPHVTGCVALMYSVQCESITHDLSNNPSYIALKIKNAILYSAKPNQSLENITLTGKRLQVDAALSAMDADCKLEYIQDPSIRFLVPNPASADGVRVFYEGLYDTTSTFFELYTFTGVHISTFSTNEEANLRGFIDLETNNLLEGLYVLTMRNNRKISTAKLLIY